MPSALKSSPHHGYTDSYLLEARSEPMLVAEVRQSWSKRLWLWLKRAWRTTVRALTPLEESLQGEVRRLVDEVKARDKTIAYLEGQIEALQCKIDIGATCIDGLNEIIESLRAHRRADVLIDGKRIAVAEMHMKGMLGGGLNHGSY